MKIPFCTFCVRTRILCSKCQELVDSGRHDYEELDVVDALLSLEDELPVLKELEYRESYVVDDHVIVVLERGKSLSRDLVEAVERALSKRLGRKARVIFYGQLRELISQLVSPARVLTVSVSYLPDGTTTVIIRILQREARRLPYSLSLLEKIVGKITGSIVRIEVIRSERFT